MSSVALCHRKPGSVKDISGGSAYNFGMILLDFLRLLADTPKEKHPALIAWFTTQKKASTNFDGLDNQALRDVVSKESHR